MAMVLGKLLVLAATVASALAAVTQTTCYYTDSSCAVPSQFFCSAAANAQGLGATCINGCFDTVTAGATSCGGAIVWTCQATSAGAVYSTNSCDAAGGSTSAGATACPLVTVIVMAAAMALGALA